MMDTTPLESQRNTENGGFKDTTNSKMSIHQEG